MRKYTFMVGLLLVFLMAGCASAPQPGTPVTHATACDEANNDKRVSLEGYPRISGLVMVSDDMGVDLFEKPGGEGTSIPVYLTVGSGSNQVETIPDNFSDADLKIHTNDNKVVSTDSRIKVTGSMLVSKGTDGKVTCLITEINLIEAATIVQ
jgi:hypothetical protein